MPKNASGAGADLCAVALVAGWQRQLLLPSALRRLLLHPARQTASGGRGVSGEATGSSVIIEATVDIESSCIVFRFQALKPGNFNTG
jgi:hypothetical protein